MRNNLFSFATSELSQDAFICWAINWFNDERNPKLQEMSRVLLKEITGIENIQSVDIFRQFSKTVYRGGEKVKENKIEVKIDVLLIVNETIPIIIEDKTYTGEHDDQIERYKEGIAELVRQNGDGTIKIGGKRYKIAIEKIITVYWKTGFYYDADQKVIANKKMSSQDIISILKPYENESDILQDYLLELKSGEEWYSIHSEYWNYNDNKDESDWNLNVARNQIAQYRLMREIFPKEGWITGDGDIFGVSDVYHGTSYGRPWTEKWLCGGLYADGNQYEVFWRIDTDNYGPYLSLRLYESSYKKGSSDRHVRLYNSLKSIVKRIVENESNQCSWCDVNPGNKGNYKEAAIFHYHFSKEIRNNWNQNKELTITLARNISEKLSEEVNANFQAYE